MTMKELILADLGEIALEVCSKYWHALQHIGVDFDREDVQAAVLSYYFNMEDAFQATIGYWLWRGRIIEYPSAFLISALSQGWKRKDWDDNWLKDPELKNPCLKWWEEAEVGLAGLRNVIVADVNSDEHGNQYVLFTNGKEMSLETAKRIGWQRLLNYASEQGLIPFR